MTLLNFYVILHLFGVAFGAGGAYMSDAIFMKSIKDKTISDSELGFMKMGGYMVWFGLILLYVSGSLIFLSDPSFYLSSHKFLAKFTIVIILTINGYFFHKTHLPIIEKHENKHFADLKHLAKSRKMMLISGVISVISWTFAIFLGGWKDVPFNYFEILGVYFFVLLISIIFSSVIFKRKFVI